MSGLVLVSLKLIHIVPHTAPGELFWGRPQTAHLIHLYFVMLGAALIAPALSSFRARRCGWAAAPSHLSASSAGIGDRLAALAIGAALDGAVATALAEALEVTAVALYTASTRDLIYELAASFGSLTVPAEVDGRRLLEAWGAGGKTAEAVCLDLGGTGNLSWAAWAPLAAAGTPVGLIALGARRANRFDGRDALLLRLILSQLSLALKAREDTTALERSRVENEALRRRTQSPAAGAVERLRSAEPFYGIVGASEALRSVLSLVQTVGPSDASVLITGETGTGKELVARTLHRLSPRRAGPLVSVNCPAIPSPLAESELFGHERGAFTDAVACRSGKFEQADGGTVFLDEVADLPLEIQAKLLRVLQEREVTRVGGHKARRVDVRLIAATNRDLRAEVRCGRFREDLFYRLAALEIELPALRDRTGDIPLLAAFLLEGVAARAQKPIAGFSCEALALLGGYHWPGNVRELQNAIERAVLLCRGTVIQEEHLPALGATAADSGPRFASVVRQDKRRRIMHALSQTGGNQAAAARQLGMSRSNLARMMKTLGIPSPRATRSL